MSMCYEEHGILKAVIFVIIGVAVIVGLVALTGPFAIKYSTERCARFAETIGLDTYRYSPDFGCFVYKNEEWVSENSLMKDSQ